MVEVENERIQIRLTTKQTKFLVPPTPILVPLRLKTSGLTELIHHMLALETKPQFDFLIDGVFLKQSLLKYTLANNISRENVVDIEYIEAMTAPTELQQFEQDDWISAVQINSTQNSILCGYYDKFIRVLDYSGNTTASMELNGSVKSAAWLDETKGVAGVFVWEMKEDTIETLFSCQGHKNAVNNIVSNADIIATCSQDSRVMFWKRNPEEEDFVTSEPEKTGSKKRRVEDQKKINPSIIIDSHTDAVSSIAIDAGVLYSGSWDHTIKQFDIATKTNTLTLNCEKVVLSMALKGDMLATGHVDDCVRVWDIRQREKGRVFRSHKGWVSQVKWSESNDNLFSSAGYDGVVNVWDLRSSLPVHTMRCGGEDNMKLLAMDWTRSVLCVGGEEKKLKLFTV